MKHLEIKSYEQGDIKVTVKLDYDKGQITLVDPNKSNTGNEWAPTQYTFAKGGLERTAKWVEVLTYVADVVRQARTEMMHELNTRPVPETNAKQ